MKKSTIDFGYLFSISGNHKTHFDQAYKESRLFLLSNKKLYNKLSKLFDTCYSIFPEIPPSDFESLMKIGYFPFYEANIEIEYAVFLALGGIYKIALEKLRSFLELNIVGIYFLSLDSLEEIGPDWLKGITGTPFFKKTINKIFQNKNFIKADSEFSFKQELISSYWQLCDFVHTKGQESGHMELSHANFPRFAPVTLKKFINIYAKVTENVAIALALQMPIILQPLPIFNKFGFNPPASGFLESYQVEQIKDLIDKDKLTLLEEISCKDQYVQGVKKQIESMPDLTDVQLENQWEKEKNMLEQYGIKLLHHNKKRLNRNIYQKPH